MRISLFCPNALNDGSKSKRRITIEYVLLGGINDSLEDAEKLKIGNSEVVEISTRRGEITAPAFVTKRIQKGVIYIPFHYKESPANRLTNPAIDPIAKIPEYKVCAAKVSKISKK